MGWNRCSETRAPEPGQKPGPWVLLAKASNAGFCLKLVAAPDAALEVGHQWSLLVSDVVLVGAAAARLGKPR